MPPKQAPPLPQPRKQAPKSPTTAKKPVPPKKVPVEVSNQFANLLRDQAADAQSIVDFVVRYCGLEGTYILYDDGTTFLHFAARANRLDVLKLLLAQHSPNINAVNIYGCTALHYATFHNNLEMVQCLVEANAFVDSVDNDGRTPLFFAVQDNSNIPLLLLALGADPSIASVHDRTTPLHYTCQNNRIDLARSLLASGAPVNAVDRDGKTPLDLAMGFGQFEVVSLLRSEGGKQLHRMQS